MSYGVCRRRGLDTMLLWLWSRLVATVLLWPLAWEPPYATGAALEKAKDQKKITRILAEKETSKCTLWFIPFQELSHHWTDGCSQKLIHRLHVVRVCVSPEMWWSSIFCVNGYDIYRWYRLWVFGYCTGLCILKISEAINLRLTNFPMFQLSTDMNTIRKR